MERGVAEEVEDFPDAGFPNRRPPLIPNATQELDSAFYDVMDQVHVAGDLLAVPAMHEIHVWHARSLDVDIIRVLKPGQKITAIAISKTGRYIWAGTREGELFEVDNKTMKRAATQIGVHVSPIAGIYRVREQMWALDISGRLSVWMPDTKTHTLTNLHGPFRVLPVKNGWSWVAVIDSRLWLYYGREGEVGAELRVFDPNNSSLSRVKETTWTSKLPASFYSVGAVSAGAVVPAHPDRVFLGHHSGHVSVWDRDLVKLLFVQKVSLDEGITGMVGPSRYLWIGFKSGYINVLDVGVQPWRVIKRWQAHEKRIERLFLDPISLWSASSLRVVSSGKDLKMKFWDGFLRNDWMTAALCNREPTYCTFRKLRVALFSWNVDGGDPSLLQNGKHNQNLLRDFFRESGHPDVIQFGFQETIDLSDKELAFKIMLFATKTHDVTGRYRKWLNVLQNALDIMSGPGYELVTSRHLVGLSTFMFAKSAVKAKLRDIDVCLVKTGLDNKYGNKGAIITRFVLDDSSLCFVNSHLAAGKAHPTQRIRDLIEILDTKASFKLPESSTHYAYVSRGDGTRVADHELTFCSGDLNFRIQLPRQKVLDAIAQQNFGLLQQNDELIREMATNPSFRLRSFKEPTLMFKPTYKYDHNSTEYDTSAKQRTPAWCDRVLYRSEPESKITPLSYLRYEASISDHRPISASFDVSIKSVDLDDREDTWRQVIHDWAKIEEDLLETARSYYPPGV